MKKETLELAKKIAHEVWEKYDDTYGYRTEKQKRNKEVATDHPDNMYFFWQQFDSNNQAEFVARTMSVKEDSEEKQELIDWIEERIEEEKKLLSELGQ